MTMMTNRTTAAGCEDVDRHRARFYDTTYTVPRFNNSGTRSTVIFVQNASDRDCIVTFDYLGPGGNLSVEPATGFTFDTQMLQRPH